MAGTIAHELSQPLQVINVACAAAREELVDAAARCAVPDGAYVQSRLDRVAQQVETLADILRDLRSFVRGIADNQPRPFDPAVAVRGAIKLTEYGARRAHGRLSVRLDERLPFAMGNIGRFEQALVSLVNYMCSFEGWSMEIVTNVAAQDGRQFVRVIVDVSVPAGIPEDVAPEPSLSNMTTKTRMGSGTFGLGMCRRIIEEMGGKIAAADQAAGAFHMEILLPVADPSAETRA